MIVFQESYSVEAFERRLFLNGKTYVQLSYYSKEKQEYVDRDEDDLCGQLCRDYRHYPEDINNGIVDGYGMGLQYGYIINEVAFLYGGTSVDWNIKNIHEWEKDMISANAIPATPPIRIPPLSNTIYQLSWHHDGSADEVLFYDGKEFTCRYGPEIICSWDEKRIGEPIPPRLEAQYGINLSTYEPECYDCNFWKGVRTGCYWTTHFLCLLRRGRLSTAGNSSVKNF